MLAIIIENIEDKNNYNVLWMQKLTHTKVDLNLRRRCQWSSLNQFFLKLVFIGNIFCIYFKQYVYLQ